MESSLMTKTSSFLSIYNPAIAPAKIQDVIWRKISMCVSVYIYIYIYIYIKCLIWEIDHVYYE